jgi:hypothetical protein
MGYFVRERCAVWMNVDMDDGLRGLLRSWRDDAVGVATCCVGAKARHVIFGDGSRR